LNGRVENRYLSKSADAPHSDAGKMWISKASRGADFGCRAKLFQTGWLIAENGEQFLCCHFFLAKKNK